MEGLRAWVAEVERKLGKRTRVFLALTVIAIGIAGASLYLAIDARNSSVSESDVQELQEQLEARIGAGGASALTPPVETTPPAETTPAPAPQPEGQSGKPGSGSKSGGGSGTSDSGSAKAPGGVTGGAPNSTKLQELFEEAKKRSEANE